MIPYFTSDLILVNLDSVCINPVELVHSSVSLFY